MARLFLAALLVAVATLFGASVGAAEDTEVGRLLADRYCSDCHFVGSDQVVGSDTAPPFAALAKDEVYTEDRLAVWLADPHPPMPKLDLTSAEIDAIAAYILSLRP